MNTTPAAPANPGLHVEVLGVGLLAPGLPDWAHAQQVFRGHEAYQAAPTVVPAPQRLPAAERRRAGLAIKLALAAADAACAHASADPAELATVFTSSSGDGSNCHALCEMLAGPDRLISPTRFTNSVHNAAAGYWHIAVGGRQPSTSLCAFDASLGAGLLEAALQVQQTGQPVLLVSSDAPYPEPLHATRPIADCVGLGLVLAPVGTRGPASQGRLSIALVPSEAAQPLSVCSEVALADLARNTPTARVLPVLEALARSDERSVCIDYQPALRLRIDVTAP
jgi:hypothetical protein